MTVKTNLYTKNNTKLASIFLFYYRTTQYLQPTVDCSVPSQTIPENSLYHNIT